MDNEKLQQITSWLRENVFQDINFMFSDGDEAHPGGVHVADIIASLHNLLYEQVTGERYNYMFHWANKIGSDAQDNIFDGDKIGYKEDELLKLNAKQPITEVEPVVHAHWVVDTWCSNCSRFPVDVSEPISNQKLTKLFSRCPHCGAKMDESSNVQTGGIKMSITKIERKYIDAKDYVFDEIICIAETINYRKRTRDCYDKQMHLFTHLCSIYASAFGESLSVTFDSDGFIEKVIEREEYTIRKFSKNPIDWGCT